MVVEVQHDRVAHGVGDHHHWTVVVLGIRVFDQLGQVLVEVTQLI